MDDRRSRAIVAAVVIVVILGVGVLIWLKYTTPTCQLSADSKGLVNASKGELLADTHLAALANFTGYLEYAPLRDRKYDKKFMGFHINSIHLAKFDAIQVLTLAGDCAQLHLNLDATSDAVTVRSIKVDLVVPNDRDLSCIVNDVNWQSEPGTHYKCLKQIHLPCFRKSKTESGQLATQTKVAMLVVEAFEFEVNGDPELVQQHKFTFSTGTQCRQVN